MNKKNILYVLLLIAFSFGSYYWGFLCGKQELNIARYDQLLMNLSSNIMTYDAIAIDRSNEIKPVIVASIESDFAEMVKLYEKYNFARAEHMRCAISRRFRSLQKDKKILHTDESKVEYPIQIVSKYLNSECEGAPSHENWLISSKTNKSSAQEKEE